MNPYDIPVGPFGLLDDPIKRMNAAKMFDPSNMPQGLLSQAPNAQAFAQDPPPNGLLAPPASNPMDAVAAAAAAGPPPAPPPMPVPRPPMPLGKPAPNDNEDDTPAQPPVAGMGGNVPMPPVRPADLGGAQPMGQGAPMNIQPAGATAPPDSPGFFSSGGGFFNGLRNIYGNGGPGDSLINLGLGMASNPSNWAAGAMQGLQMTNQQKFQQAQNNLNNAKAQQANAALSGGLSLIKRENPGLSDQEAASMANNPSAINDALKKISGPNIVQQTDEDGNAWNYDKTTGQRTIALKASDAQETYRPMTAQEQQQWGINPDSNVPYRMNTTTNKPEAIGGGGTTVNLSNEKTADTNILNKIDASQTNAKAAVRTLGAISRQQTALDSGSITGGGADPKLAVRNMISGMLGIPDPGVEHTQEFIAAANQKGAELAKQISNAGHTTNADLNMGKIIGGADINYSQAALREIGRAQQQLAMDTISEHNASLDKASKAIPAFQGGRSDFYKVEAPQPYDFSKYDAVNSARQAIAKGAPRAAVMQRLKDSGIDPGGL